MALKTQNMASVGAYGDQVPEGCYHFRIDKVDDQGEIVFIHSKIQTEPFIGRSVRDRFEMSNQTALAKLKSYYKAVGYEPGPEGHDPEQTLGGEFTAVVVHNVDKGNTYANIAPWSIQNISESPVQPLGAKEK